MPSPFPGMDPYLEAQAWPDFHHELISGIRAALTPALRPRYVVRVEERVYLERYSEGPPASLVPDVVVAERHDGLFRGSGGEPGATATIEPVTLTLPIPEEVKEAYLTLRDRESMEVVTVIEVLSPANKRRSSDGRREYLEKRAAVLRSQAHLVELDLLRAGDRLPTKEPLPIGDYYALVTREHLRPAVDVYAWHLSRPLPSIPLPLARGEQEVMLELQPVFEAVYDRAGYDYSLDYTSQLAPPVSDADAAWLRQALDQWMSART